MAILKHITQDDDVGNHCIFLIPNYLIKNKNFIIFCPFLLFFWEKTGHFDKIILTLPFKNDNILHFTPNIHVFKTF